MIPFALLAFLGLIASVIAMDGVDLAMSGWALALTLAVVGSAVTLPWSRMPTAAQAGPALLYLLAVALLRDATGGSESGLGGLTLLPVLWFALYGTRVQVVGAAVAAGLVYLAPIVAVGGIQYPPAEWVRGALWMVIGAGIGVIIQNLVTAQRDQARELTLRSEQLAESSKLLESTLDGATEASIIATDMRGRITVFNSGAERMLGYTAEEVIGADAGRMHLEREIVERAEELGAPPSLEVLAGNSREGGHETRQWTYRRKDGSELPVELTVTAIRDQARETTGYIGIATDISERLKFESDLLASESALLAVSRVSKAIASSADARRAVCEAGCELSGAAMSLLLEMSDEDTLVMTGATGVDVDGIELSISEERSASSMALRSGERLFLPDARESEVVSKRINDVLGVRSVAFEPIKRGEESIGVLVIAWHEVIEELDRRSSIALDLLSSEAGLAIERDDMLRRLRGAALTDQLTGLPNRRAWDERLPGALADAEEAGEPTCVAILDLDCFKAYNDDFGHQAGDRLLVSAGASWRQQMRSGDMLARYGGEEFGLLITDCSLGDAYEVVERIRSRVPSGVTCSAGLAMRRRGESAEGLIARADVALYEAKSQGRDRTIDAESGEVVVAQR